MELEQEIANFIIQCENRDFSSDDTETLKVLRDQGRSLENLVSFCRRIIQTRLDIVGETSDPTDTTLQTPSLGENPPVASRFVTVELNDEEISQAEEYVHSLVGLDRGMSLDLMSPQDRQDYRRVLEIGERTVSKTRQKLHSVMDELADELVKRYREGVVAGEASPPNGR